MGRNLNIYSFDSTKMRTHLDVCFKDKMYLTCSIQDTQMCNNNFEEGRSQSQNAKLRTMVRWSSVKSVESGSIRHVWNMRYMYEQLHGLTNYKWIAWWTLLVSAIHWWCMMLPYCVCKSYHRLYICTCNSTWAGAAFEIMQSAQMMLLYCVRVSSHLYGSTHKSAGVAPDLSEYTAYDHKISRATHHDPLHAYYI